jgi:flagellar motility protein MotE (MotC chaperone)
LFVHGRIGMPEQKAERPPTRALRRLPTWLGGLAGAALLAAASAASAEEAKPSATAPKSDSESFCANIVDAASDARFAWEARTLQNLKEEVEAATAALEAKRAELEKWTARREEFQKMADESVVDIYAKMRPEAAAAQLGALDGRTAAAVLMKLKSRTASAILAEMDTPQAVSLAQLISSGGEPEQEGLSQQ